MKHFYYSDNDQQLGPFTFEELKSKRLKKSTLVWTDGMTDWASADTIEELKEILISEPPPLPKKEIITKVETINITQTPISNTKYDLTYIKEIEATVLGIFLIVVPLLIKWSGAVTLESEESYNQARKNIAMISLVVRIAVTFYIVSIASRQNRNSTGWGWFAFFLPSIASIVIGQLRKLRLKIELDGSLPLNQLNQQVLILMEKASKLYYDDRHLECIEILDKVIQLDNKHNEAIKLRGLCYYQTQNFDKAKVDFATLNGRDKFCSISNYYLGNIELRNFQREKAVEYWLAAQEKGNDKAKKQLDRYHNFTGKYLLSSSKIMDKIYGSEGQFIYFTEAKYKGGFETVYKVEEISKLKTKINGYLNGLDIVLNKTHFGIAYYEITDIELNEKEMYFTILLFDKTKLSFAYDHSRDYDLKKLCSNYHTATGKTLSAASAWTE